MVAKIWSLHFSKNVYPRKQNKVDKKSDDKISLIEKLQKLIMEKFGNDTHAFYAWSKIVHEEVRLYFTHCTIQPFYDDESLFMML